MRTFLQATALALAVLAADGVEAAPRIDQEDKTTWRQLTWEDFRGPAESAAQASGIEATVILEVVALDVDEREDGTFAVRPKEAVAYALMEKLESGVRPKDQSDEALAHEQVHFDIAEIHARRLHAKLATAEVVVDQRSQVRVALRRAMQKLQTETIDELEEMQALYDKDTKDGKRKSSQAEWTQRVAELLAAEEPYPLL